MALGSVAMPRLLFHDGMLVGGAGLRGALRVAAGSTVEYHACWKASLGDMHEHAG